MLAVAGSGTTAVAARYGRASLLIPAVLRLGVLAITDDWRDPCDEHMAPDLGWLQRYVQVGFFTDYRRLAWRYYAYNETSYAFLWLNSIAFGNLEFLHEACPEAARLALLLRAEERLPMRESELPLLEYALHAGKVTGLQALTRVTAWPLSLGVERLQRMAAAMGVPQEFSVDVVMAYCDEPLDGLLSRTTGYDHEWLAAHVPLQQARLILYRLETCVPPGIASSGRDKAALALLPPRAVIAAERFKSVEIIPVNASPAAWEAARYLWHLASRYSSLADFTVFLHPDVFEHVNPRTLRNVLQALQSGTFCRSGLGPTQAGRGPWFEYLSLSHHYLTRPSRARNPSSNCTDAELGFDELKLWIFGQPDGQQHSGSGSLLAAAAPDTSKLGTFGFYCCSQFLVHRDRVQRRSREWYQRVADGIAWEHCATSYMELLWHGIFNGGRLHEEKRQERTELPLFLRVDNFLEQTSDGLI